MGWKYKVTFDRSCIKCGSPFNTHRKKITTCDKCRVCFCCGVPVYHSWRKFCGFKCFSIYAAAHPRIRECIVCGKQFSHRDFASNARTRKTCSDKCKKQMFSATVDRASISKRMKDVRASGCFKHRECVYCTATYKPTSARQRWCGTCIDCTCCGIPFHRKFQIRFRYHILCGVACLEEFRNLTLGEKDRRRATRRKRPPHNACARPGHIAWQKAVIDASGGICSHCKQPKQKLEAHHILPWKEHPELRNDVSNGEAVCYQCHKHYHFPTTKNRQYVD